MTATEAFSKKVPRFPAVGLIFALALGLRIFFFWQDKVVAADGISYIGIARAIFDNFDFRPTSHYPPVFPMLIGAFSYLTPYDEVAGKVVSTLMGSLLVIPLFLLGKELFSEKVGHLASLLAAFAPSLIAISGIVLSQSTYITFLVTALYLCWKSFSSGSWKLAVASGAAFALAYLTRPEAVIVFAAISAALVVFRPAAGLDRKGNLKLLVAAWGGFFVLAFPYMVLLHDIHGTWRLTGKSSVTLADSLGWYLNRPDLKREPGFGSLTYLDIIRQYPDFLWKNSLRNLPAAWAEASAHIWLLALLGAVSAFLSSDKGRKLAFLGGALLPLAIIIVFFWIDRHYFSPTLPILFLLAGEGLVTLERKVHTAVEGAGLLGFKKYLPSALLIGGAIALGSVLPALMAEANPPYHFSQDGARYDHKLIGLMLKGHLPANSRVMVKSGRIAFYGNFQQVDIPQADLPEVLLAAKRGRARYLIADGTLLWTRPQMTALLTPLFIPQEQLLSTGPFPPIAEVPGDLKLVLLYKDPRSVGVAVYELLR